MLPYAFRTATLPVNGEPRQRARYPQAERAADVLAVSANPTLAAYFSAVFRPSGWTIARTHTLAAAIEFLRSNRTAVAVFENALPGAVWQDALAALESLPEAPALIVVGDESSLVDEVTAAGGFDALIRPLRESDVVWTLASAWHSWIKRHEGVAKGVHRCSGA